LKTVNSNNGSNSLSNWFKRLAFMNFYFLTRIDVISSFQNIHILSIIIIFYCCFSDQNFKLIFIWFLKCFMNNSWFTDSSSTCHQKSSEFSVMSYIENSLDDISMRSDKRHPVFVAQFVHHSFNVFLVEKNFWLNVNLSFLFVFVFGDVSILEEFLVLSFCNS